MASPNVDLVRSIFADWERGDYGSADWAHPEIEFVFTGNYLSPGASTGLAAMAERWREFLDAWDDVRPEAEEYRELDTERVLVLMRVSGHGKRSGLDLAEIQPRSPMLFHLRGCKVTRLVFGATLADLGLGPEGASQ